MELIEVQSKQDQRLFIEMVVDLYKDQHFWIRPLDKDIEAVFDVKQNKTPLIERFV